VTSPASFPYAAFARSLTNWFALAQRDLPWRHEANARDPYRVLVSEVMLQQTTVAAVIPFYTRFLERFPTLEILAAAGIEDVLPLWAGLGYYSRARNLHACARAVMEKHGGQFPRELHEVLALPGIGRYTAGAVTSIAFDHANPIVDANVARVLARVRCIEGDIKAPAAQKQLWHQAEQLVWAAQQAQCAPGQFNPAMMELGALICRPRDPDCAKCPVADFCAARASNRQHELPQFAPRPASIALHDACVFIAGAAGDKVLLRQRPHDEKVWWRGMWELPRTRVEAGETPETALHRFLLELGVSANIGARVRTLKHGVTVHDITLDCFAAQVQTMAGTSPTRWFAWEETEALALPSTMRQLLRWLRRHPCGDGQLSLL
jgi:A/G-specific adenine glycosylase